jgi:DNA-binding Xre family transcriptional regulator
VKWNLRLTAANRGIWKASDLQRALSEHGLHVSLGKMSALWAGQPQSVKLTDLDVICVVLNCTVADLLVPEPDAVTLPGESVGQATGTGPAQSVVPRGRPGRSLPPA